MKIGYGYDVHRLTKQRRLIIGGVDIPFKKGLLGHSDADVLCHAIGDALLGAAALGDLGDYFPSGDDRYQDISSLILLKKIRQLLDKNSQEIVNIDATIIAEKPQMKPYISQMRRNIADNLNINLDLVSIKATTTEGLGFTGTGQGIAAYAVCLIDAKI
jgi:2-C-methyl-D-erythritol 2,4-cyclodiphosphate synthase